MKTSTGFAVIDLETTGLSPAKGARAIEIGMVLIDTNGAVQDQWETLINPGCGAGPTHIHGVDDEMLDGAPSFHDIAGDLATRLDGRTIVAHNAMFDVSFLDAEFRIAQCKWKRKPLCTMRLARSRGIYPTNLAACCHEFGIVNHGAHHALGDALATAELLVALRLGEDENPGAVSFPSGHPEPSGRVHRRPSP